MSFFKQKHYYTECKSPYYTDLLQKYFYLDISVLRILNIEKEGAP